MGKALVKDRESRVLKLANLNPIITSQPSHQETYSTYTSESQAVPAFELSISAGPGHLNVGTFEIRTQKSGFRMVLA
jgi:hypothetical protein